MLASDIMPASWAATLAPAAAAVAWTLLHSFWQAAVLWIGIRALAARTVDAKTRYVAGNVALALLLAMQVATLAACLRWGMRVERWFVDDQPIQTRWDGTLMTPTASWSGWADDAIGRTEPVLPWLLAVWCLVGAARLATRMRAGAALMRVLALAPPLPPPLHERCLALARDFGLRRPVRFIAAAVSDAPGTIGWLRPYVFVPPALLLSMTPAQLEAFVAHELAHIVRRDYVAATIAFVVDACYACNPFVRAIVRRLDEDAELCCDQLAVSHVGDPHGYATALATLADRLTSERAALGANGGSLTDRVLALLAPMTNGPATWVRALGSAMVACLLIATATASLASVAARQAEAKWLSERSLPAALTEILDRPRATADEQDAANELLGLAALNQNHRSTLALSRALHNRQFLYRLAQDPATRLRLLKAARFENDRGFALAEQFAELIKGPLDTPAMWKCLSEQRLTILTQYITAQRARSDLNADGVKRLASLADRLFPGELQMFTTQLRAPGAVRGSWQTVAVTTPPRVLPRPTTRPQSWLDAPPARPKALAAHP